MPMNTRNGKRINKIQQTLSIVLIGAVVTLSGCAGTEVKDQPTVVSKEDPYESINRKIFNFNDKVDDYIAEPISDAYKWITPQFMQTGIFNFFNNLKNINVVLNDVLQGKFEQSAEDTGRFAINSTVGLAGLFDVAKEVGLEQNDEDFEQTLAVWGVPQGSYLVLPLLGPSTARGIPGTVFDTAANPVTYVGVPVQLVSMLNARANAEGALKFIDEAALDPYVFTRESFLQWRQHLATDGKGDMSNDLSDLEDELLTSDGEDAAASETADAPNNRLELSADNSAFNHVSDSFVSTAQSFEETAKSFEDANSKIDKLSVKK
jgi:phospholipid-binding lipoprotein MlaA